MYKLRAVNHSNGVLFVRFIKHSAAVDKCRPGLTECQCWRRANRCGCVGYCYRQTDSASQGGFLNWRLIILLQNKDKNAYKIFVYNSERHRQTSHNTQWSTMRAQSLLWSQQFHCSQISHILWILKTHHRDNNSQHWSLSWSRWIQSKICHTTFYIHFNITLTCTPKCSKWSRSSLNPVCTSLPLHVFHSKHNQ
jgi:hypothetical protein